jgi:EmrB/QacA subfamily drug resistance transporter
MTGTELGRGETGGALAQVVPRSREKWILAATVIASTMAFSDMTIVNVALPVLQRELGVAFSALQWVVESYTLMLSTLILVGGAIGDIYGRRRVFTIGIVIFAAASAGCGLSQSPGLLIAARAIQGLGAALMMPGSLAIVSASFPSERQGYGIGIWSSFTGMSTALAPALGGWLINALSWHAAFLINLPLAAISLAITLRYVPESRQQRRRRLDVSGMLWIIVGLGALTYGLISAGEVGFRDLRSLGPLVVGVVALALFVFAESRATDPMIPLPLFRVPGFGAIQVFTFLLWAALHGTAFFVPLRLMQIHGFAPTEAGAALLPLVVTSSILSRYFGRLADQIAPRTLLTVGACLTGAGFLYLAMPDSSTRYVVGFLPALLLMGVGMGVCQVSVTVVAMNAAGRHNVGTSSAINNAAARTGGLVAIAVFGLVLVNGYDDALAKSLHDAGFPASVQLALEQQHGKLAGSVLPAELAPDQHQLAATIVADAFVAGYRRAMILASAMAFASALLAARCLAKGPLR